MQALFSVGLLTWQGQRNEEISKSILQRVMMRAMDECISKLDGLITKVVKTSVRGQHAAACITAMTRNARHVQECTREFVQANREQSTARNPR